MKVSINDSIGESYLAEKLATRMSAVGWLMLKLSQYQLAHGNLTHVADSAWLAGISWRGCLLVRLAGLSSSANSARAENV